MLKSAYSSLCFALALLLFVTVSGCWDPEPRLLPIPADGKILAFGDSLTFGTGAPAEHSYPRLLQSLTGRNVINAGVPGELSAAGRKRLPGLLDRHQPALLILCHGGNDFLRRRNKSALHDNLVAMIEAAQQRGIQVLLVGIPDPGIFLSTAEIYNEVAAATGVAYEDQAFADVLDQRDLKSDTVHPNAAGYRQIAGVIHARLVELGAL